MQMRWNSQLERPAKPQNTAFDSRFAKHFLLSEPFGMMFKEASRTNSCFRAMGEFGDLQQTLKVLGKK